MVYFWLPEVHPLFSSECASRAHFCKLKISSTWDKCKLIDGYRRDECGWPTHHNCTRGIHQMSSTCTPCFYTPWASSKWLMDESTRACRKHHHPLIRSDSPWPIDMPLPPPQCNNRILADFFAIDWTRITILEPNESEETVQKLPERPPFTKCMLFLYNTICGLYTVIRPWQSNSYTFVPRTLHV